MNGNTIELPYNIGDVVYYLDRYENYYNFKGEAYTLKNGDTVVINMIEIEHLLVNADGIFIVEDMCEYVSLLNTYVLNDTSKNYASESIFKTHKEALDYIKYLSENSDIN